MIDAATLTGPGAGFVAGLVTSFHCIGMCGPVACAFMPEKPGANNLFVQTSAYHGSRILSYTLIGAMAGAIGAAPLVWFQGSRFALLPWVLVLFFVLLGLGMDKRIPKLKRVSLLFFRLTVRFRRLPATAGASVLGFVTPLLPCGPLYLVFAVALTTGSALAGAEFLMAFALGTLPLLWVVHLQAGTIRRWLTPKRLMLVQRGLALLFAAMISLRLVSGGGEYFLQVETAEDGAALAAPPCPLCPTNRDGTGVE